jgi:transcriptional regulator with XRE-family HTH domain
MSFVTDSLSGWERLAEWLNQEMDARHLSTRQLAKKAGISHSVIAKMANADGTFTAKSLNGVADALGVPREKVQQMVGLLPEDGELLPEAKRWSARLMALSDENRVNAIRAMEMALVAVEDAAQPTRR